MVLDAVLVISLPQEYKLAGAAVATALSQVVGGGVPLLYFAKKTAVSSGWASAASTAGSCCGRA